MPVPIWVGRPLVGERAVALALLRGLLGYALAQLDQYEMTGGMLAVAHD